MLADRLRGERFLTSTWGGAVGGSAPGPRGLTAVLAYANILWHVLRDAMNTADLTGDELVQVLATLASPHRMRVLAALSGGRNYVSRLARDLNISRALLQVHLKRLEKAGLVSAHLELSEDGKAMKFYEVTPFVLHLTPQALVTATATLTDTGGEATVNNEKEK